MNGIIPAELWSYAQSAGIGVIPLLVIMWWRAEQRADRAEKRADLERAKQDQLSRETITAMVKVEANQQSLVTILSAAGRSAA